MSVPHGAESRHARWLARAALASLAAAALFGLWLVPVKVSASLWPIEHHARLLAVMAVALAWVGAGVCALFAVGALVVFLVGKAGL